MDPIIISMDKEKKPSVNFTYQQNQQNQQTYQNANVQLPQQNVELPVQQMGGLNIQSKLAPIKIKNQMIYATGEIPAYQNNIQCAPHYFGEVTQEIRLLNKDEKEEKDKKVVAMIVSFVNGCSYDNLFTSVEQKSQEGTKVLVYSCNSSFLPKIIEGFTDPTKIEKEELKDLLTNMKELDPDCVVFNWECSSGYGGQSFSEGNENIFQFLKLILERGHMAMFSDFSLKALINCWSVEHLGPNPFKKTGEINDAVELFFRREDLVDCPSAQLQIVGEMAENGKAHVEVMGGTILYSVNKEREPTDQYDLKLLTIASNFPSSDPNFQCEIGGQKGNAGHVLLTYKNGGHLLTSMGHWIELMRIDTSEKKLFQMAEKQYGTAYAAEMQMNYKMMDVEQQRAYISKEAVTMVQNQAPCSNMSMKTAYKKY